MRYEPRASAQFRTERMSGSDIVWLFATATLVGIFALIAVVWWFDDDDREE